MSVADIPTRATSLSKSCFFSGLANTFASISPPSIPANALGSLLAYSTSPGSFAVALLPVGPLDRNSGRALGHLLGCLCVAHDGRQVAFELQLALKHSFCRVELFVDHLLPPRVRGCDHEITPLRVARRTDLDVASGAIEQVHHDAERRGEILVGLRL